MLNKLRNRKKKGFTLIELIVVLVIMVILAAAAIPTIMNYVENSRKAAYLSNARSVYQAAQSAVAEATANGNEIKVADGNFKVSDSVTFTARVTALCGIDNATITVVDTAAPDALTDKNQYQIVVSGGKVTKIIACYQKDKTVTLEPGVGSDVMDTTSTSQA